jgi:hypothetical protein
MSFTTPSNGFEGGLPIGKQLAPLMVTSVEFAERLVSPQMAVQATAIATALFFKVIFSLPIKQI